jgi:DNA primase
LKFETVETAQALLRAAGVSDKNLWADFKLGYSDGSLSSLIPEGGEVREALVGAGLLTHEGGEAFEGCVVFPWFDENNDCAGMAGLRVKDGEWVYLDGPRAGIWNLSALKRSRSILMASNILDGLRLCEAGFRETVSIWGPMGLTEDHKRYLQRYGTKEAFLVFEARPEIIESLAEEGLAVRDVKVGKDLRKLLEEPDGVKVFETLLTAVEPATKLSSEKTVKVREEGFERTARGFSVKFGKRRYEVKGLERDGVRLRVTLKAWVEGVNGFFLDSVDLYSMRSRGLLIKSLKEQFGEKVEVIEGDVQKLLEGAETHDPKQVEGFKTPELTEQEKLEAMCYLKDPKLLDRILEDFDRCGLAGEEANKLIGYLAAVSRKLDDPLAVLIQSRSAAGKSTLQEAILRFVPPEDVEKYTRLTGQALFYKDEGGLSHKLLAIEEEAGAREASYSIRNLQSSKCLSIATTEKDSATGKMRTVEYKVKGPVALMLTTTAVDMDFETQNRFITLTIDESNEMTERILTQQRQMETLEGLRKGREREKLSAMHQNVQRLLRPLAVVNPFAPQLVFPAGSLRARRDHKKYLGLIRAIAFLHQYQRPVKTLEEGEEAVKYVEVTPADIEKANTLMREVLGRTLDELSAPGRALLRAIREMVKEGVGEQRFTRRDIRQASGWSDFQVKTHLGELVELEYLGVVTGRKGKEYLYELVDEELEPQAAKLVGVSG